MVYFNQGDQRNLIKILQLLYGLRDRRFVGMSRGLGDGGGNLACYRVQM